MKTINVYQSEEGKEVALQYIGKVKYIGETFFLGFTNDNEYDVVYNLEGNIAVVDDEGEDYLYSLKNPAPADGSSKGGRFEIVDDPQEILTKIIDN